MSSTVPSFDVNPGLTEISQLARWALDELTSAMDLKARSSLHLGKLKNAMKHCQHTRGEGSANACKDVLMNANWMQQYRNPVGIKQATASRLMAELEKKTEALLHQFEQFQDKVNGGDINDRTPIDVVASYGGKVDKDELKAFLAAKGKGCGCSGSGEQQNDDSGGPTKNEDESLLLGKAPQKKQKKKPPMPPAAMLKKAKKDIDASKAAGGEGEEDAEVDSVIAEEELQFGDAKVMRNPGTIFL